MQIKTIFNKKNLPFITGFFIVIIGIISFVLISKSKSNKATSPLASNNNSPLVINDTSVMPSDTKTLGILLLGYGGAGHDGGYLTDAVQVFYADFDKGKLVFVSIPRDLWIKLPDNSEAKINSAWTYGTKKNQGANVIKAIVSQITGLPLNYFAGVDFVGFQKAIGENIKGIEVNVRETLDDPWYPLHGEEQNLCGKTPAEVTELSQKLSGFELERQFPCRYEHLHFDKGLIKMQGGEALKYVRSRHGSNDGDIARGRRQQEVLLAIGKKLFSLNTLNNIPEFYKIISKNIQTDLDPKIIEFFIPVLKNAPNMKPININLSTDNALSVGTSSDKQSIILPKEGNFNWSGIQKLIKDEMGKN